MTAKIAKAKIPAARTSSGRFSSVADVASRFWSKVWRTAVPGEFGDVWRALGDRDVKPSKFPPARHDWPPRGVDGEPIA